MSWPPWKVSPCRVQLRLEALASLPVGSGAPLAGPSGWARVEQSLFLGHVVLGCSAGTGSEAGFQRGEQRGWQVTGLSSGPLHILS